MSLTLINLFIDIVLIPIILLNAARFFTKASPAYSPQASFWLLNTSAIYILGLTIIAQGLPEIPVSLLPTVYINTIDETLSEPGWFSMPAWQIYLYIIAALYMFVFLILIQRYIYYFLKNRKLTESSNPISTIDFPLNLLNKENAQCLLNPSISSPFVWGIRKPKIVLPTSCGNWSADRRERVLYHELAHIQRKDWLTKNILEVTKCIFWFMPPVWKITERASELAEYACDDRVIQCNNDRASYAEDILELSSNMKLDKLHLSIVGGSLSNRILLILDPARTRQPLTGLEKFIFLTLLSVTLIPTFMTSISEYTTPNEHTWDYSFQLLLKNDIKVKEKNNNEIPFIFENRQKIENVRVISSSRATLQTEASKISAPITDISKSYQLTDTPHVRIIGLVPDELALPEYPQAAIRKEIEASITVIFDIDASGKPDNIRFPEQPHLKYFKNNIIKSLQNSRFSAFSVNNNRVEVIDVIERFRFSLEE